MEEIWALYIVFDAVAIYVTALAHVVLIFRGGNRISDCALRDSLLI